MNNRPIAPHLRQGLRTGATALVVGVGVLFAGLCAIDLGLFAAPPLRLLHAGSFVGMVWLSAALVVVLVAAKSRRGPRPLSQSGPARLASVPARFGEDPTLPSLTYPIAVFAALAPLSLHSLFASGSDFLGWAAVSAVVVPHAHFAFALWMVKDIRALLENPDERIAPRVGRTVLFTSVVAAVPGALLMLLPPVITGLTALAILVPTYCVVKWARPWLVNAPQQQ